MTFKIQFYLPSTCNGDFVVSNKSEKKERKENRYSDFVKSKDSLIIIY